MARRRSREKARQTFSQHEFEASRNLIDCEDCGTEFNLGAQPYFGPRCPLCRRAAED